MSSTPEHQLVPIWRDVLADLVTPVRAYPLLCPPGQPGFLLESVEGGERLARYSFVGFQPRRLELPDGDPLPALKKIADVRLAPTRACRGSRAGRSATSAGRRRGISSGCRRRQGPRRRCRSRPSWSPRAWRSSTT
jgi:hypothetical protein